MKNNFMIGLALMLSTAFNAFSQTYVTQVKPAGSKTWGYANIKGELIIPAQYAKCYKFGPEGYAPIYDTQKKQYYFINIKGEALTTEVQGFKLIDGLGIDVHGFEEGLVPVRVGEKWGYLNTAGKLVIAAKYEKVTDFNSGYAVVQSGGKRMIIDTKGTEIAIAAADAIDVRSFAEGLAPYRAADKTWGFIGKDGKVAIPAKYESVGYFSGGIAWAKETSGTLGYLNTKGEWAIKPQFTTAKEFNAESGLARVKQGEQWAYVNLSLIHI